MLPNIHILGIQGSGKGTQSALLTQKYGLSYVSSGELFRSRAAIDDELGRYLNEELSAGRYLADSYLFQVTGDYLQSASIRRGLLADGVIRTLGQEEGLRPVWERHSLEQPLLINLVLSEEVALERLIKRGETEGRSDDHPEAIKRRFEQFHAMTEPVISIFQAQDRCITLDANQSVEALSSAIGAALEERYPSLASHVTD